MKYDTDSITGKTGFSPMRWVALALSGLALLGVCITIPQLVENLDATEVMIIQSVGGTLNCYTDPGPAGQWFGSVTKYPRQKAYKFDTVGTQADPTDTGKELQFNDGGKAHLYGTVNWEMPRDCKSIIEIHRQFGSAEGIEERGVAKMVNTAVQLSGPSMSSTESSAERRAQLVTLIDDQAQHGVYQTRTRNVEQPDPITGEKRMVLQVEIVLDDKGVPKRQQGSILEQFGVHLQPMSLEKIIYSKEVDTQIAERQKATQQVQLAQANARKAEQDYITSTKQGEAKAAVAKWEQEAIKAKAVTEAQQQLEVATLSAKQAEQYKIEQIARGQGDAERRRLVLAADNALDQRLKAYVEVNAKWAEAFAGYKGAMVPGVQMGGNGSSSAVGTAQTLVDLLTAKTARDLAVDAKPAPLAAPAK